MSHSAQRYVGILERAMQIAGGEPQLARLLRTSPSLLRRWLTGREQPPINKYIVALQFVTSREP